MVAMMLVIPGDERSKKFSLPPSLKVLGWLATILMTLTLGLFIWSNLR